MKRRHHRRRSRDFEIGDALIVEQSEQSGGGLVEAIVIDFDGRQDDGDVITVQLKDGRQVELFVSSLRACLVRRT